MPDDLDEAYRRTTYWVEAPDAWIPLRVDQASEGLDRLLASSGAASCALITADNPGSRLLQPAENRLRREALAKELQSHRSLPAIAVGDDGRWPPELGLLVLGIDESAALALARRHGQRAILVAGRGAAPRLRWA